jgi:hypothetical protein
MATIDLGKIKQVFRGTYNNATAYAVDDLVVFTDGQITSTYICTTASTGNNPSSGGTAHANWAFIAKGVADPIPSQSGNAGKVLKTDGSSLSFDDADAGLQSMNVYSTAGSHTWTKPTGIKKIKVFVTGAGGGGMSGPNNDNPGSSGGGGGTAIKIIDVTSISSVAVTVGAGGNGVTTSSGVRYGNGGGTSSFGSHCSATGGGAGYAGNDDRYGGIGGVGSGGDLNLHGDSGTSEGNDGSNNPNPPASPAGASFWGGLGMYGANNSGLTQANVDGYHGSAGGNVFQGVRAGNGGPGLVVVENYK